MWPKKFNDLLALVLVALTFILWGYVIVSRIPLDAVGVIIGATINVLTVVATFYFRKAPREPPA